MIKFLGGIQLTTERGGGEGETPGPRGRFAELTQQQLGKRREGRGIKEEKREASSSFGVWDLALSIEPASSLVTGPTPPAGL